MFSLSEPSEWIENSDSGTMPSDCDGLGDVASGSGVGSETGAGPEFVVVQSPSYSIASLVPSIDEIRSVTSGFSRAVCRASAEVGQV